MKKFIFIVASSLFNIAAAQAADGGFVAQTYL